MTPFVQDVDCSLYVGDAAKVLRGLPEQSVHAVLTSPPFYGLRDYGVDGQIGLEESPEAWADRLVAVFREARRVLRDDGTLWVECGDSYASDGTKASGGNLGETRESGMHGSFKVTPSALRDRAASSAKKKRPANLKPKDLLGQPWLLAFALRADGWWLRGAYIWEKPDAMPESATDRCTTAHSYLFHFSKSARYFHDQDAIRERFSNDRTDPRPAPTKNYSGDHARRHANFSGRPAVADDRQLDLDGKNAAPEQRGPDGRRALHVQGTHNSEQHRDGNRWPSPEGRNARSVWKIATEATSFGLCPSCRTYWPERAPAQHCGVDVVAHFATWPHELAGRIIACASPIGGTVLDPFAGSATSGRQARVMGRNSVLIELSPDYAEIAAHRLSQLSLLAKPAAPVTACSNTVEDAA